MKKIVAVLWHTSACRMRAVVPQLAGEVSLSVWSARALSDGTADFDALCAALDTADFYLFNRTASDSIWPQILAYVQDRAVPTAYVGSDAIENVTDEKTLRLSARCNEYYSYGGTENYKNLVRLCAREAGDKSVSPDAPKIVPWEGIFHPDDGETVYSDAAAYFAKHPKKGRGTIGLLMSRANWIGGDAECESHIIRLLAEKGYDVLPVFTYSWAEPKLGARGPKWAIERYFFDENGAPMIDALVKMTGFFVGGRSAPDSGETLKRLNCPVFKPLCSVNMRIDDWERDPDGTLKDVAWSIALPELEGNIEPIFLGGTREGGELERREPILSRCQKLCDRIEMWVELAKKPNREKRCVFILNNNPCASVEATVGGGAKLDTLESVARILKALKAAGYAVADEPENGKALIDEIMEHKAISDFRWTTVGEIVKKGGALAQVSKEEYLPWFLELPERARKKMIETWGDPPGEEKDGVPPAMVYENRICVTGVQFGNALVCVQPKRGCAGPRCDGTVCKILHDPHCPPTHQYFATYRWFERVFKADFIVHVGTHGNLEFLPGRGTGLSDACFPDACIGRLPNLYIYNADNPPEGTIAKRRALATIVDHMQTTYIPGGLYEDLEQLDQLIEQYENVRTAEPSQAHQFRHQIIDRVQASTLKDQIKTELTPDRADTVIEEVHKLLTLVRNTQVQDGMHIFGEIPAGEKRLDLLYGILRYESGEAPGLRTLLCRLYGFDFPTLLKTPEQFDPEHGKTNGAILADIDVIGRETLRRLLFDEPLDESIDETGVYHFTDTSALLDIAALREHLLDLNARVDASDEMGSFQNAANGRFVAPGPAGVVTRGRDDVIPTGRNFYTMDPDTVPTRAAWVIGQRIADAVLEKFLRDEGHYPESFGMYWMCNDLMWGGGEGMAQLLYFLGVRPKWQPNGKVTDFEILPLSELKRPRIDVSVKLSGILRDNFKGRYKLLDRAILAVAKLDEPPEQNYVRKHTLENMADGALSFEQAAARIFGARPGTYLNGITLQVYASAWKERGEMADVYTFFNGYSYSSASYGEEAYKVLQNSLKTVEITYNKVMTDEHDLLGCCCYYGVQGGMTAAARTLSGREVRAYYGDSREAASVEVRTMSEELNRVVQSKLLNPKWIEGQKRHGYKGAGDISKRVGRVYGWQATTGEVGDWVFDEITRTYVENEENFQFFKENNPWAMEEMERRLIEAEKRGLWKPADGLMDVLRESYVDLEGVLEESAGDGSGSYQGGSVDIKELGELEAMKKGLAHMHKTLQ
ncbi:MAG: cobaltochelatase subunit CobN [Oscillospiraceae bacterium]|jgi:cobaltochelatase CobN